MHFICRGYMYNVFFNADTCLIKILLKIVANVFKKSILHVL